MKLFIAGMAAMYFGTTILTLILGQLGFFEEDVLEIIFCVPIYLLGGIVAVMVWLLYPIIRFKISAVLFRNGFNPWRFKYGDIAKLPQSEQEEIVRFSKNPDITRKILEIYREEKSNERLHDVRI